MLRLAAAKKEKWLKENPGQMVITAGQMVWTAECEKALSDADGARKALKLLKKKWISYLNKLTAVTCSKLSPIDRNKVSTAHGGRSCGWGGARSLLCWGMSSHCALCTLPAKSATSVIILQKRWVCVQHALGLPMVTV